MLKIIYPLISIICGCSHVEDIRQSEPLQKSKQETYTARVTYYWPGNGGQVGYQTSTGKKPICGKTAAVDPKIIPYGSRVFIPDMGTTVIAIDTGGDVISRKASLSKKEILNKSIRRPIPEREIVIDIFCANVKIAQQRIKKYPMFMKIIVEK
jgi:3D (Asp-Asp-Asp) domain-containing protein